MRTHNCMKKYLIIKRLFDIVCSFLGIVLLSPILVMIAVLIKITSPRSCVIFKQERYGKNSEVFTIYKFRTMKADTPNISAAEMSESGDVYTTRLGNILRKTSLDELPQLFNILKGDMSIIGPRPVILAEKYVAYLRHKNGSDSLTPGLTGLAQISGRNSVSDNEKVRLDGVYLENISFIFDIKIFFKTIFKVLKKENIDCSNEISMKNHEKVRAYRK